MTGIAIQPKDEIKRSSDTKTGKKVQFKPGQRVGMLGGVPDTHVGRWCDSDPANIQKKLAEGWNFVNKTTCPSGQHVTREDVNEINDGGDINGAISYRELIGMALPREMKEARDEYYHNQMMEMTRSRIQMDGVNEKNRLRGKVRIKSTLKIA